MSPSSSPAPRRKLLVSAGVVLLILVGAVAACAARGDHRAPQAPHRLKVVRVTRTTVLLRWSRGHDNRGVTAYDVYAGRHRIRTTHHRRRLRLRHLTCGTRYRLSVRARDAAGNRSRRRRVRVRTERCPASRPPGVGAPFPTPAPGTGVFNETPLFTDLDHSVAGTHTGATQSCDLAGRSGILYGTDHPISFRSGGATYRGCYSINSQQGAVPAGGGRRPAVFSFAPGLPRPGTTSGDAKKMNGPPKAIGAQGKAAGWDMIFIGMFQFRNSSGATTRDFTYDQVYVDYVDAVIADLLANHNTDPKRIYAVGRSAGGRVPAFLACHLSSRFAAVVVQGGFVNGPGINPSLPTDRCSRPANPVSVMYVNSTKPVDPDGTPNEHYAVHITPTHASLTAADVAAITTVPRPDQVVYAVQHVGEAWAYWNGCANNLVTRGPQTVTVGLAPNNTPNSQLWQWTGCRDKHGGTTGAVDLYLMPGSHGVEPQVEEDGRAFDFLNSHPR